MAQTMTVRLGEREYHVEVRGDRAEINGVPMVLDGVTLDDRGTLSFRVGSRVFNAVLDLEGRDYYAILNGHDVPLAFESHRDRLLRIMAGASVHTHHHAEVRASMPGMIVRLVVQQGQSVEKGQALLILEAMKMENKIRCPAESVVREIHVQPGQTVEKGDLLLVLD